MVMKDLIAVDYMHIVWNVNFEAVSERRTGGRGNDIPTYVEQGGWGKRGKNHCFRYLRYQIHQGGY